jgi:hypothetical protein
MLAARLRVWFLFAILVASFHVTAAPRFWTLTGVRFDDGTVATGYFSYDDATQTISNWNVRVDFFSPLVHLPPFTYVPGNSVALLQRAAVGNAPQPILDFVSSLEDTFYAVRSLLITPAVPLDGSNATVSFYPPYTREDLIPVDSFDYGPYYRIIIAGSLTLAESPPPVTIVQVDEFYNPALRHYFITANAAEKQDLDTGVHLGWVRTGESFKAFAPGSGAGGSINPVCRYYGDAEWGLDSHFLSADAGECLSVFQRYASVTWMFESDNVFQINLPDKANGTCPVGTIPVYRLWNQRADSNHRYTTSTVIRTQMLAAGYLAEGYGAEGVVMCALQ